MIRNLPRDDDTCGWINTLPPRPPPRHLSADLSADWVIVGAGYTGCAAARRITELMPEARVVVVDAQRAGESASGRNSGFAVDVSNTGMGPDPRGDDMVLRRLRINLAGIELLRAAVTAHGIDCQWSEVGKLHGAAETRNFAELDTLVTVCTRLGIEHQDLDRAALARRLGTDYYRRGVLTPRAVMLQPAALARGLAASLPPQVALYEETPVIDIDAGRRVRLTCRGGRITAPRLILAANALLPALGVLRRRIAPMTLTGSMTRPLTGAERTALGDPGDWGVLSAHPAGATVRYTRDHRIAIRNTAEWRAGEPLSAADLALRRARHEAGLRARFPMLPDLDFEYTWAGLTAMTRNFAPFFGRLRGNVFAAGGYNGSGIARGTAYGSALVDYALGAESALLRDIEASPSPAWVPPRPLLDLGLAWRLHRARRGSGREA